MGKSTRVALAKAEAYEESLFLFLAMDKRERSLAPPPPPLESEFSKYSEFFVRDPSSYRKGIKSSDRGRLRDDMARHLFRLHPVPIPLSKVWLCEPERDGGDDFPDPRALFAACASGKSLFKAFGGLLTRKESHLFSVCKADLPPKRAALLCVCLATGATHAGAMAVASSKMANMPLSPAWKQAASMLSLDPPKGGRTAVDDICDFLRPEIARLSGGTLPRHLSTRPLVERAEERWRRELAARKILNGVSWDGIGIPDTAVEIQAHESGSATVWALSQISDAKTLAAEGAAMRHCVLSYRGACSSGRSSIWSLTKSANFAPPKRCLTVEVENSSLRVVQARGLANRAPKPEESRALLSLCAKAGISFSPSSW